MSTLTTRCTHEGEVAGRLGPGMDFISLLDDEMTWFILKDFLQNAVHVRVNLEMVMQDMPRGRLPGIGMHGG